MISEQLLFNVLRCILKIAILVAVSAVTAVICFGFFRLDYVGQVCFTVENGEDRCHPLTAALFFDLQQHFELYKKYMNSFYNTEVCSVYSGKTNYKPAGAEETSPVCPQCVYSSDYLYSNGLLTGQFGQVCGHEFPSENNSDVWNSLAKEYLAVAFTLHHFGCSVDNLDFEPELPAMFHDAGEALCVGNLVDEHDVVKFFESFKFYTKGMLSNGPKQCTDVSTDREVVITGLDLSVVNVA